MNQTQFAATEAPGATQEWLTPSAALGRFEPPAGSVLVEAEESANRLRYGFRIGRLGFLIDPETGSEVVPLMRVSAIPNGPSWLHGMINLRGNLVPVFDLRRFLALEGAASAKPLILVLGKGERTVGLMIDDFPQRFAELRPLAQLPPLPEALARHVSRGYTHEDDIWLEFEHEPFFEALAGHDA